MWTESLNEAFLNNSVPSWYVHHDEMFDMAEAMRQGDCPDWAYEMLDSGMKPLETAYTGTLHRGLTFSSQEQLDAFLSDPVAAMSNSVASMSESEHVAQGFCVRKWGCMVRVQTQGARAWAIGDMAEEAFGNEQEVCLPPSTYWVMDSITTCPDTGYTIVNMRAY